MAAELGAEFQSPGIQGEENPFKGLVSGPDEIDAKTSATVNGFNALGRHLAVAMRKSLLPIDVALVGKDTSQEDENGYTILGGRLPVWLILEDTNLTGDALFHGKIGTETCSYSLWSGESNGHRTEYKEASKQEIMDLKRPSLIGVESVYATEKAVGLDGLGRFVLLQKFYKLYEGESSVDCPTKFTVPDLPLKPSDFFDITTGLSSDQLVKAMDNRMKKTITKYTRLLQEEKNALKPGEPLQRPVDYYDARYGVIYRSEKPSPGVEPQKRKIFGLFTRKS
jgi:hypothetical protein